MSIRYDDSDFLRLELKIRKLGKLPQKCVTRAAKKGAGIILRAARKLAPKDTGNLKRGLTLDGEKLKKRGKKVYQVVFDGKMNDVFQKQVKEPGKYGGKYGGKSKKVGYYPASMNFGFLTPNGKKKAEKAGFLDKAAEEYGEKAKTLMIEVLEKEIDKEWSKK